MWSSRTNRIFTTSQHNNWIFNPSSSTSRRLIARRLDRQSFRVIFRSPWEPRMYSRVRRTRTSHASGATRAKMVSGLAGRMETPVCVHKHVRELLCKFLNTTGPYILRLRRGAKNKISIATNVSRLKRPLSLNIRAERVARIIAEEVSSTVCPAQLRKALISDHNPGSFSMKYSVSRIAQLSFHTKNEVGIQ